jgi:peptidylprolyl isomerase/peptidyl-prolyl cis-trans isomerase B (cyclophilin B)
MKSLSLFLMIIVMSSCFFSSNQNQLLTKKDGENSTIDLKNLKIDEKTLLSTEVMGKIHTTHGDLIIAFYPTKAPNTVNRIIQLIQSGFYDGTVFHRVVPQFVIQGGDPTGTGQGGSGKALKAEFNDLKHEKGSIAMARTTDPDSADSQFYIAMNALPHLDNNYTIFGKVVEGLDIIDKIKKNDKMLTVSIINNSK